MLTPIAVNTDRLPDEADWPKNLGDLADPKYAADKIAFCDPGKSGTGATIANNIASLYGWEYITEMLDNCEVLSGSDPMFDAVKDGTIPLASSTRTWPEVAGSRPAHRADLSRGRRHQHR